MPNTTAEGKQLENLDRLQRADHDILIEVRTNVSNMASDVREIKDGTTLRITAVETRLDKVEENQVKTQTVLRTLQWVLGAVVASVSFIIATLSGVFHLFGR